MRRGAIQKSLFLEKFVDIALVRLCPEEPSFDSWLPVIQKAPSITQAIYSISFQDSVSVAGSQSLVIQSSHVFMLEGISTLCRALYYSEQGMLGSPILTRSRRDDKVFLIGVHIGVHISTLMMSPFKKVKSGASTSSDSLDSSIDRHTTSSCCIICIASKVQEIMAIINPVPCSSSAAGPATVTDSSSASSAGESSSASAPAGLTEVSAASPLM